MPWSLLGIADDLQGGGINVTMNTPEGHFISIAFHMDDPPSEPQKTVREQALAKAIRVAQDAIEFLKTNPPAPAKLGT